MFGITQDQIRKGGFAGMVEILGQFDDDTEVWEGDARDLLIGDADEMDEDEAAQYRLIGTVAEVRQQYADLVAARWG